MSRDAQAQEQVVAALRNFVHDKATARSELGVQIDASMHVVVHLGEDVEPVMVAVVIRPHAAPSVALSEDRDVPADTRIELHRDVLWALLRGEQSPHLACLDDALVVHGDERAALRMGILFA